MSVEVANRLQQGLETPHETEDFYVSGLDLYASAETLGTSKSDVSTLGGQLVRFALEYTETMDPSVSETIEGLKEKAASETRLAEADGLDIVTLPFGVSNINYGDLSKIRLLDLNPDEQAAFAKYQRRGRVAGASDLFMRVLIAGENINEAIFSGQTLSELSSDAIGLIGFTRGSKNSNVRRTRFNTIVRDALSSANPNN